MFEKLLGDYSILKQLGQGALGTTYLAEHKFLKRPFILKVLPKEFSADPAFIKRFEERIKALSIVDHPALVKIHNVSHADGSYFLVSEHKQAVNLATYLEKNRGQIAEEKLLQIATGIGSALDFLHQKKYGTSTLSHLSLKPGNVLIHEEKGDLQVYLSDYGLAPILGLGTLLQGSLRSLSETLNQVSKSLDPDLLLQESLQLPDTLKTSLEHHLTFLAPEWRFGMQRICTGQKADIYAFGVLVYYMIMRELPQGVFDLPSKRAPKYEKNWDQLISKALQSHPGRRPDSLRELLAELKSQTATLTAQKPTTVWSAASQQKPASASTAAVPVSLFDEVSKTLTGAKGRGAATVSIMQPAVTTRALVEEAQKMVTKPEPVLKPQELQRPVYDEDPAQVFQIDSSVVRFKPSVPVAVEVKPLLTDMTIIQGGSFYRGSDKGARDEQPRHKINLDSFALDIHPVTNEQFVRFLEAMGGEKDVNNLDIICLRDSRIKRSAGRLSIESGYTKHPVVGVSWYGAVAYAKWVGKRLPTEAEWEIAAYGNTEGNTYPFGDEIERSMANFFSADTTPVMSYPPNDYGLFDMAGNVYEWCEDWYDYNSNELSIQEPNNPKGPHQGVYRVLRGGCWKSLKEDLRCAHRHRNNPRTMNATYGFRCAADIKQ